MELKSCNILEKVKLHSATFLVKSKVMIKYQNWTECKTPMQENICLKLPQMSKNTGVENINNN